MLIDCPQGKPPKDPSFAVRLGPFNDKKTAEETAKRLKTKEHLNPRLAQLKPKPAQAAASNGARR